MIAGSTATHRSSQRMICRQGYQGFAALPTCRTRALWLNWVNTNFSARVVALHVRPLGSAAPRQVADVHAIAGFGLEGDRHAARTSPRQVLIASTHAYHLLQLPPVSLRQNVLVDLDVRSLVSGDRLLFDTGVELVTMFACEPCGKLDRQRAGLSTQVGRQRGILARVVRDGLLRQGDSFSLSRAPHALWSENWRDRVQQVLGLVPPGCWISFSQLAQLAGLSAGYCRAFRSVLSKLPEAVRKRARPAGGGGEPGAWWDGNELHDLVLRGQGSAEQMRVFRTGAAPRDSNGVRVPIPPT